MKTGIIVKPRRSYAGPTLGPVLVVTRYRVADRDADAFRRDAGEAMSVLSERAGFVAGWLGRNADEPDLWTLTLLWRDVGSYRRALSVFEVKMTAVPLLSRALDEPGAYVLVDQWPSADHRAGGSLGDS